MSLAVERQGLVQRTSGFEVECIATPTDRFEARRVLAGSQGGGGGSAKAIQSKRFGDLVRNDPIDTLIITTKAPHTIPAIHSLVPRLSSKSTVVLCQNGMGVLEGLLDKYWPSDTTEREGSYGAHGGRPSFICATTTHGAWRKGMNHVVHAGLGDIKFGVVPNRAVLTALAADPSPVWESDASNPLLNSQSLLSPTLDHLPSSPATANLRDTISHLLNCVDLRPTWLPLPTLQIAQLQKLAVNTSVNSLTATMGVNNGALIGSPRAKSLIESITTECSTVFAAHLAQEEGRWSPSPTASPSHPPPPPLPASHPLSAPALYDYTLRVLFSTSVNFSSTLQDLLNTTQSPSDSPFEASRTEIDFINGYVGALARRYGLKTPVSETMGALVNLKEDLLRAGAVDQVLKNRASSLVKDEVDRSVGLAKNKKTKKSKASKALDEGRSSSVPLPAAARRKEQKYARAKSELGQRAGRFERDREISLDRSRSEPPGGEGT